MAAQMTYVTTVALTYANHALIMDQDSVVNKYMGIFCAFYRSSYIWGNLITTLVLSNNQTLKVEDHNEYVNVGNYSVVTHSAYNATLYPTCGSTVCDFNTVSNEMYDISHSPFSRDPEIPETIKYMLLCIYLGCGFLGAVILVAFLDKNVGSKRINNDLKITTKELFMSTVNMLKDSRCQLLIPLVFFVGLEQGFIFGDFTKVQMTR